MTGQYPAGGDRSGDPAAAPDLADRIDAFGKRHPALMLAATMLVAVIAAMILLAQTRGAVVLYQAF